MTAPPYDLLAVPHVGITFAVSGEADAVARLRQVTAPFYQPVAEPEGHVWRLTLVLAGDHAGREPADDSEPDHRVEFDAAARTLTVTCPAPRWLPVFGLRYTRTIVRTLAIAAGAVPLHGAGVDVRGVGLMLVGDKWAGKTTAAMSLVRSGSAALVSNDDVLLQETGVDWQMVGGPRSMGVRTSSLGEHRPLLRPAELLAAAQPHPAKRPSKAFLFPGGLTALGGAVRATAPAHAVVELVCRPDEPIRHEELSGRQAADVLRRYLETTADRRRLGLVEALGAPTPALTDRVLSSLVGSLRFHRFSHPVSGWVDDFLTFVRERVGLAGTAI
ncbi:hypothetical protein PH213_15790 [Streptomyces sp. SRF1]|uniref:hypothetical protein n=1 Tax=Streptomyces sp. SRF1 TaxID=1549642 RepID=UPI0025AFCAE0|nr:hypothetical protein [Streptomyces sp. SRF1]MDN3055983.1 hypothetical protein [Streptomyces sp. SRF1]